MSKHSLVIIGLGSNLGDRAATLRAAIKKLAAYDTLDFLTVSPVYATSPMYVLEQPEFLNACAAFGSRMSARQVLQALMQVEQELGRVREVVQGPRTLDLDLLCFDEEVIIEDDLTVPHPALDERAFVLAPLHDIAPGWVHPVLDVSVRELWELCPGREEVRLLPGLDLDPLFSA